MTLNGRRVNYDSYIYKIREGMFGCAKNLILKNQFFSACVNADTKSTSVTVPCEYFNFVSLQPSSPQTIYR